MNNSLFRKLILLVVMTLMVASCGGGTGGTGVTASPDVSAGTVTKLGSVFVNGVEFDTTGASITLDGQVVSESQVEGMAVEVSGGISGDTGSANTVKAETAIKGIVDDVLSTTTMTVMGQTVRLDDAAIISTLGGGDVLADLTPGTSEVEISGLVKPGGVVIATYVEEKSGLVENKVKGYINTGSVTATTFDIGALTVTYSGADLSDLPGGPTEGSLVEVKANPITPPLTAISATKVEAEGLDAANAPEAEVEGYVKDLSGTSPDLVFFVAGQEVHTDASTVFKIGNAGFLIEGIKVEVEGQLSGGILQAVEVSLRDSVRMEGDITGLSGNTFQLEGMTGITITVDSATEINSTTDDFATDFADGTHVRLRAFPSGANTVLATRLDERSPDIDAILRGPVNSFSETGQTVEILGTTISTAGLSFQDENDLGISEAEFFAALQQGRQVKVKGTLSGVVITWTDAELED